MVCCEVDEHQLCHNIQPVSCMLTGSYEFFFWQKFLGTQEKFNCTCMGRFDTSGTSKNDNFPKVLVGHGVKKYGIKIFFKGLQAEIWLFVYIL